MEEPQTAPGRHRRPSHQARPGLLRLDARTLLSGLAPRPLATPAEVSHLAGHRPGHAPRPAIGHSPASVVPGSTAWSIGASGAAVAHGRVIANIAYTRHGSHAEELDLYLPEGSPPPGGWPVVLAFPGGGWRHADRKDYGRAVSVLTQHGYAVAGVDYTYADPRSAGPSWPTNLDDAREAVRWVRRNAPSFGFNPDKVVAMGESSGAHLALLLGTDPAGSKPGEVSARVNAVVDFYGPTDLATLYAESRPAVLPYFDTFLGGPPSQDPGRYADASPLSHVGPGSAPTLIVQGLADRTVAPEQSIRLDAALTRAGVRHRFETISWAGHGFRLDLGAFSFVPDIVGFLNGALGGGEH